MARERKAPPAASAVGPKVGRPQSPTAREEEARRRPVYEVQKSGHSDLVTLLALRERPPFDDEYVDTQTLALVHKVSASYFQKLRVSGGGPPYVRIGSQVRYRFGDAKH